MLDKVKNIIKEYWVWIVGILTIFFLSIGAIFGFKKQVRNDSKKEHDAKIDGIDEATKIKEEENAKIKLANAQASTELHEVEIETKNNIENLLANKNADELSKLLAKEYNIHYEDKKP